MVGISSAAKVAVKAAQSSTVRNAATSIIASKTLRSAASDIVSSTAVPIITEKIKSRWGDDDETEQDIHEVTAEKIGKWRDPSTLGLSSEAYSNYLWTQILLLGEYESHLEDYEHEAYQGYMDDFYSKCEELEIHVEVLYTLVDASERYLSHLEQYAVRDAAFREYVQSYKTSDVLAKDKPTTFSSEPTPEEASRALKYLDQISEYQEYLLDYSEKDPEYQGHIGAYGHPLRTLDVSLEMIVNTTIERIDYLEDFKSMDGCFDLHCEIFDPPSEEYREFLEAENTLLRQNA